MKLRFIKASVFGNRRDGYEQTDFHYVETMEVDRRPSNRALLTLAKSVFEGHPFAGRSMSRRGINFDHEYNANIGADKTLYFAYNGNQMGSVEISDS